MYVYGMVCMYEFYYKAEIQRESAGSCDGSAARSRVDMEGGLVEEMHKESIICLVVGPG